MWDWWCTIICFLWTFLLEYMVKSNSFISMFTFETSEIEIFGWRFGFFCSFGAYIILEYVVFLCMPSKLCFIAWCVVHIWKRFHCLELREYGLIILGTGGLKHLFRNLKIISMILLQEGDKTKKIWYWVSFMWFQGGKSWLPFECLEKRVH